jgi:hypothetical protein
MIRSQYAVGIRYLLSGVLAQYINGNHSSHKDQQEDPSPDGKMISEMT